jgi:regulator of protease activity HflC (stomatin/prohibitin superfamily)
MSASLFDPATEQTEDKVPVVSGSGITRLVSAMQTGGRLSAWLIAIVLIVVVVMWHRVVYVVPAGGAGVRWLLFFGGTVIERPVGEGLQLMFPWDLLTIYDTRKQAVDTDFTALTNKGLPIQLKLTIRYHPEFDTVALLHQQVGSDYVVKIVKPTVESVLRRYVGREEPEAIYTNKEGVLSSIIARAIEEISAQFVSIDDVIIREVALPEALRDAISTKLVYQQQAEGYEFRLVGEKREAERKKIEAEGIDNAQKIIRQNLTPELLRWEAIRVEGEMAKSTNSKLIIMDSPDARKFNLNVP